MISRPPSSAEALAGAKTSVAVLARFQAQRAEVVEAITATSGRARACPAGARVKQATEGRWSRGVLWRYKGGVLDGKG
jgi:hypothetical protein